MPLSFPFPLPLPTPYVDIAWNDVEPFPASSQSTCSRSLCASNMASDVDGSAASASRKRPAASTHSQRVTKKRAKASGFAIFEDSPYLQKVLHHFTTCLSDTELKNVKAIFGSGAMKSGISVGTLFSGSDVQHIAGSALSRLVSTAQKNSAEYKPLWSCDNHPGRQRWLKEVCARSLNLVATESFHDFTVATQPNATFSWCLSWLPWPPRHAYDVDS